MVLHLKSTAISAFANNNRAMIYSELPAKNIFFFFCFLVAYSVCWIVFRRRGRNLSKLENVDHVDNTKENVVMVKKSLYADFVWIIGVALFGILLNIAFLHSRTLTEACLLFVLVSAPHAFLVHKNDRILYDENGVTIYTIWGKPCFVLWSDFSAKKEEIDRVFSARVYKRTVLTIQYCIRNGDKEIREKRSYPYYAYSGLTRLLLYSQNMQKNTGTRNDPQC